MPADLVGGVGGEGLVAGLAPVGLSLLGGLHQPKHNPIQFSSIKFSNAKHFYDQKLLYFILLNVIPPLGHI